MVTTHVTPITKIMAHLPLSFFYRTPESALVICFGMGTTYRSLLSWDIKVTAVELVPSVIDAFGYYFSDADRVLNNSKGRIIIDDGRRFLKRTSKVFDIITIDPPPPVEAAGVSLLLSREFYALTKKHLSKGGVLQQWFPVGEEKILQATARALVSSFKYVKVYPSIEGWGFHFIASDSPLKGLSTDEMISKLPDAAKRDILEWVSTQDIRQVIQPMFMGEMNLADLLNIDNSIVITDDKPFNEYYMLRRLIARIR
jgi:spermidine synthase